MKEESGAAIGRPVGEAAGLDARAATRLRVLNCVRQSGEASRTDIAAALKLSPATVTFVTSGLMAGGLIEEVTGSDLPEAAKRGRPRVALRLSKGRYHIAGIKVGRTQMSILVLDFDGQEVAHRTLPLAQACMTPDALVAAILDGVGAVCEDLDGGVDALAGISVGLPGLVDAPGRFVHWSSSLTRRNVELGAMLEQHLPCAAFVENDANLVAKAEQLFGEARGLNNFLVVTVEYGVGLGIVLDGRLYRGERGCGAEFGHTKVALNGASCQCGQHGCLEAYVGSYALLRRASVAMGNCEIATVRDLVQIASSGNAAAQRVLDEAGQMFALGLSNLINLFDPERIILSGAEHRIAHLHSEKVLAQVRGNVVRVDAPLPDIRVHNWDDLKWARGAAAMGIEHVSALKVRRLGK
ncbi:ROK family transcriptional regulator [Yoonia sp.]|uniref:ROK family transcriptional regulator n=1 Tax=Yoonia sp. TaxID=2212373 RepID=UPI002FD93B00